jgi:TatD DNase family protein
VYYNIHTHSLRETSAFSIRNIHTDFGQNVEGQTVSMGLHPWFLDTDIETQFSALQKNVSRQEVLAVGECGLDKLTTTSWDLQRTAFQYQIELAEELHKPLIIHCVRAFNEVLAQLRTVKVPVIFHGVNNKWSHIEPVVKSGFYLSFGKSLFSSQPAIRDAFFKTPLEQVFLETDDLELDIAEIYKIAAQMKSIPEKEIVLQLEKNFSNVFGL